MVNQHQNSLAKIQVLKNTLLQLQEAQSNRDIEFLRESQRREKKLFSELEGLQDQYAHVTKLSDNIRQIVSNGKKAMHVNPRSANSKASVSQNIMAIDNPDKDDQVGMHPVMGEQNVVNGHHAQSISHRDLIKHAEKITWPTTDTSHFASMVANQIRVSRDYGCEDKMIAKSLHDFLIRDPNVKELYVNAVENRLVDIAELGQIVDILKELDPLANSTLCPEERFGQIRPLAEKNEQAVPYSIRIKSKSKELFPNDTNAIQLRRAKTHFLRTFEYKGQSLNEQEVELLKQNSNFEEILHEAQERLEKKASNAFGQAEKHFGQSEPQPAPQYAMYSAPQFAPQPVMYSTPQTVTYTVPIQYTAAQPVPFRAPQPSQYKAPQPVIRAPQQYHGQNHVHAIETEQVTGFQSYEAKLASSAPSGGVNGSLYGGTNGFNASPSGFSASAYGSFNANQNWPTGGFNGAYGGPIKTELPENERATDEQFYTGKDANGQALVICFKCGACTGHMTSQCTHYPYCFVCKVKVPKHSTKHCPFRGQNQPGQEAQWENFANM